MFDRKPAQNQNCLRMPYAGSGDQPKPTQHEYIRKSGLNYITQVDILADEFHQFAAFGDGTFEAEPILIEKLVCRRLAR